MKENTGRNSTEENAEQGIIKEMFFATTVFNHFFIIKTAVIQEVGTEWARKAQKMGQKSTNHKKSKLFQSTFPS